MSADQDSETEELLALAREAWLEAAFRRGSFARAEEPARAAERCAQARGEHAGVARARVQLGLIRHYQCLLRRCAGVPDEDAAAAAEEELFRSALILAEAVGEQACAAAALFGLGLVEQVMRRDWNEAMPYYRRAEALIPALRRRGDFYTESEIHRHLGLYFLLADPRPERAVHHLGLSHAVRLQGHDARLIPSGLTALAAAERARGEYARAAHLAREAARRADELALGPTWIEDAAQELSAALAALAAATAPPGP